MSNFPQYRPTTMASHGMVAAPHYLAAQAGLDLL
jgi:gamma-glutamyltranspeptidase